MRAVSVYAAIGPDLTHFRLDVPGAALERRATVSLPAGVQYAWRHDSLPVVYVACSDGGLGKTGTRHFLCAMALAADGALSPLGQPVALRWRPVHVSTDKPTRFVLLAYNAPSGVTVFRINADGTVGDEVAQDAFELACTAHQVMVAPSGDRVIVPGRGNDAEHGRPEDPGSIEIFDFIDGRLTRHRRLLPDGGFGFGPRHVDFHPAKPWMYLSIERQNQIALFDLGSEISGPRVRLTTLADPHARKPRQLAGACHVHPGGRFVYVSNRADGVVDYQGEKVFNAGENTIAVYEINMQTGLPSLIQTEDTRGMHARTFAIDPSGKILVAGSMVTRNVLEDNVVRNVPGGLSVFRIGNDGRLQFVQKIDMDVRNANLFWMGMFSH